MDTNWALFADNAQFPIQAVVTGSTVLRIGSVVWVPWMKLGHYYIPRVIDRSNLSPCRENMANY